MFEERILVMKNFWDILFKPVLTRDNINIVVEIGSQFGFNTEHFVSLSKEKPLKVHSIDPFPQFDYSKMELESNGNFHMHIGLSLNCLPDIEPADVYFIDGDHNWYTVFNELKIIESTCKNTSPIIFLHDISWPYGRRDLYYNPDTIPPKYRHPFERKGILPGHKELCNDGVNYHLYNACTEGGLQNGVQTAIDDFLTEYSFYEYFSIHCLSGIGILKKRKTHSFLNELIFNTDTLLKLLEKTEEQRISSAVNSFSHKYNSSFLEHKLLHTSQLINDLKNQQSQLINDLENQQNQFITVKNEIVLLNNELKLSQKNYKSALNTIEALRAEGRAIRKENRDLQKALEKIPKSTSYKILSKIGGFKNFISFKSANSSYKKSAEIAPKERISGLNLSPVKSLEIAADEYIYVRTVSVVICVHNALDDVKECLESVWNNRSFPYEIIIVDDGSEPETQEYLEYFQKQTSCILKRNNSSIGYTKSANTGLKLSTANFVVLLNSDTIVTDSWIEKMLACFELNPDTGIVSPLSNAASYQSIPETRDAQTGDWKINLLPPEVSVEWMNTIVERCSQKHYPIVDVLNGFCFMINRSVIDKIGYLDEINFPIGYGEEVDYCLRTMSAGFSLRVIDDTYIFHEKSKSFSHSRRKSLGGASKAILHEKHGQYYDNLGSKMEANKELQNIRNLVKLYYNEQIPLYKRLRNQKIGFILTTKGGNGGANSVCNEVTGLNKLGLHVFIINSTNYKKDFEANYPHMQPLVRYYDKNSIKDLLNVTNDIDIIVGTIFTTIAKIQVLKKHRPELKVGYYVQDYEPFFHPIGSAYHNEALNSYTLIPDSFLFAKTEWLRDIIKEKHSKEVFKVTPSINTFMYNPYLIITKDIGNTILISAMVRPSTERRNPKGTLKVLKSLKELYRDKISIHIFGCDNRALENLNVDLSFDFKNHGILTPKMVAELLSRSHLFLDMSSYQAFGRTGLESMCLGCIPIIPQTGGVYEYAQDESNSIIVDTSDIENVLFKIKAAIDNPLKLLQLQKQGLQTAQKYKISAAVWSEIKVFEHIV